jgi:hypothetical protein
MKDVERVRAFLGGRDQNKNERVLVQNKDANRYEGDKRQG